MSIGHKEWKQKYFFFWNIFSHVALPTTKSTLVCYAFIKRMWNLLFAYQGRAGGIRKQPIAPNNPPFYESNVNPTKGDFITQWRWQRAFVNFTTPVSVAHFTVHCWLIKHAVSIICITLWLLPTYRLRECVIDCLFYVFKGFRGRERREERVGGEEGSILTI